MGPSKPITERAIIERVRAGKLKLPPLELAMIPLRKRAASGPDLRLEVRWRGGKASFSVEVKSLSTPQNFANATRDAEVWAQANRDLPMVVVPFLSETQLRELEGRGISGIDLCGNGTVVVPGKLTVYRTGNANRFPSSAPIKNVYRLNTSMVARAFLERQEYPSLQALCAEVNGRNPLVQLGIATPMRLGTVSKAITAMVEDLVLERAKGLRLLQSEKLLEKLAENDARPAGGRRVRLKVSGKGSDLPKWFVERAERFPGMWMATGFASVNRYATMARGEILSIYCTNLDQLQEMLDGREGDRFPNLELIEQEAEPSYFDTKSVRGFRWASPLQCYLELMAGDKRDRETADQVKSYMIDSLGGTSK